jgi:hypothetical protein
MAEWQFANFLVTAMILRTILFLLFWIWKASNFVVLSVLISHLLVVPAYLITCGQLQQILILSVTNKQKIPHDSRERRRVRHLWACTWNMWKTKCFVLYWSMSRSIVSLSCPHILHFWTHLFLLYRLCSSFWVELKAWLNALLYTVQKHSRSLDSCNCRRALLYSDLN